MYLEGVSMEKRAMNEDNREAHGQDVVEGRVRSGVLTRCLRRNVQARHMGMAATRTVQGDGRCTP